MGNARNIRGTFLLFCGYTQTTGTASTNYGLFVLRQRNRGIAAASRQRILHGHASQELRRTAETGGAPDGHARARAGGNGGLRGSLGRAGRRGAPQLGPVAIWGGPSAASDIRDGRRASSRRLRGAGASAGGAEPRSVQHMDGRPSSAGGPVDIAEGRFGSKRIGRAARDAASRPRPVAVVRSRRSNS